MWHVTPGHFFALLVMIGSVVPAGASYAQQSSSGDEQFTVSGYVRDASTGEALGGATVYAPRQETGTATSEDGRYRLALEAGSVQLRFSYVGYADETASFLLQSDTTLTVSLQPETTGLDEVTVEERRDEEIEQSTRMGRVEVPVEDIEKMPALLGEPDVIKTLQLLPGVQGGKEGTSGLYVRGGGPGQNLILLDGTPIYNVSHLLGFFSVFNSDALGSVELTKGGFPARYGGRLSSVVDIRLREGNMSTYGASGSIGLLSSKLTVEGPVIEDQTSLILSGRRTYLDLVIAPFVEDEPTAFFYDLNGKLTHHFSPQDRLYVSGYLGDDRFGTTFGGDGQETNGELGWGNAIGSLRWNHFFSEDFFSNVTLSYARYQFDVNIEQDGEEQRDFGLRYRSGIRDWNAGLSFDWQPHPSHYLRFGTRVRWHTFTPGAIAVQGIDVEAALDTSFTNRYNNTEASAYVEDDVQLTSQMKVNVGLHASLFRSSESSYQSLQPRLSARYLLASNWSVKASFATMRQYVHLLSNASIGLPTDLWVPATGRVPPQEAWQGALGLAGSLQGGRYSVNLEGYYKQMSELITYRPGAAFNDPTTSWEEQVFSGGEGSAYGVELFVQRDRGRTTGWIGYTLSWTWRQFDALNGGVPFPYRYDRRHDINLVVNHRLTASFELSASWVYGTGNAVTLPVARHEPADIAPASPGLGHEVDEVEHYGTRNGFRMPAYHRLDLGLRYYFSRQPEHVLSVGVYNAYNRRNPFFVDFQRECEGGSCQRKLMGFALFPVLPSVSYSFSF